MGKDVSTKIRVVWICHFSNARIQKKLNVRKSIAEFAPWISLGINEIQKRNDIELHIVAPHRWISRSKKFIENNIHYHFFNPGIPFYGRHWPAIFKFDSFTNFFINRIKIYKTVRKIHPDIINLHGIENRYYSSSILRLTSYPILITIQGLNSLNSNAPNRVLEETIKLEQKILREFNNFGIRVKFLENYIQSINQNANFFWFKYPFDTSIKRLTKRNKTYDCVFFARISKEKGVEDLIDAIQIVKQRIPKISLKIFGACRFDYQQFLLERVKQHDLTENIEIVGFLPTQADLHKLVLQAKLSVLPTYNDILPGTIIESLKMGIPVVAYAANGVVDFNEKEEIIRLVKVGDINGLAEMIFYLISNPKEREKMISAGLSVVREEFNNSIETDKLINAYKKIIYNNN